MKRHDLDAVSLIAATVFLVVAVCVLVEAASDASVDLVWLVPGALIAAGVAGLSGTLRRGSPVESDDLPER